MDDTGGSNSASTDASGAERDAWRLQLFTITRVLCEVGARGEGLTVVATATPTLCQR